MSNHNKLPIISLLAAVAIILSACNGSLTPTVAPTPTYTKIEGEVKVGFVFATRGDNAVYGLSQKAGAQLALDEINASGNEPRLVGVFISTEGKPEDALGAFKELIHTDKALAIIGPTLSNEARIADIEAQKSKTPVLAVSNTAGGITDIGDYIFRASLAEFQVIPETVKQAKEKMKIGKVSLLYANDDAFSKSGADVFRAELQRNNIEIVSEQTFSTNETDFKAQLQAIKDEIPDAIVVSALAKPAQIILQQARTDVGIDRRISIIGGNGFNSTAVIAAAGPAAEGLIVGAAWSLNADDEVSRRFVEAYTRANGRGPDQFAAQAYAGVYILQDAIKRANVGGKSLEDARTAIRDALKNSNDIKTALGPFSFTDSRDADHLPVVQIVKDGKFALLK